MKISREIAEKLFKANGLILKAKVLKENKFCSREIAELVQLGLRIPTHEGQADSVECVPKRINVTEKVEFTEVLSLILRDLYSRYMRQY